MTVDALGANDPAVQDAIRYAAVRLATTIDAQVMAQLQNQGSVRLLDSANSRAALEASLDLAVKPRAIPAIWSGKMLESFYRASAFVNAAPPVRHRLTGLRRLRLLWLNFWHDKGGWLRR